MPNSTTREEREARVQYLRDRHKIVISTAIIVIILATVISIPLALGWIAAPKKDSSGSQANNYGVQTACLVKEQDSPVSPSDINLRVLNGTTHAGLATAVSSEFTNRGFSVQGAGDWNSSSATKLSIIYFGRKTIAAAYTLRAQFPKNVLLKMDDRTDKLIDVVIGSDFQNLENTDKVSLKLGKKLTSAEGCIDAAKMTKLPKAQEHTEVK